MQKQAKSCMVPFHLQHHEEYDPLFGFTTNPEQASAYTTLHWQKPAVMPLSEPVLHGILLLLALPSGALGLPALLQRADDGGDHSPPRRASANDVAAALISILAIAAIITWLLWRTFKSVTGNVSDVFSSTDSSSSDPSE